MRRSSPWILLLLLAASGCECGDESYLPPLRDGGPRGDSGPLDAGPVTPSGLPCDVAMVLATYCGSCHGGTPAGGATFSMVRREQLLGPSITMPAVSMGDLAVQRMRSSTMPMPPGMTPTVPEADVAILEAWLAAGGPEGSCELPPDPFAGPDTCTSGTHWTGGDRESPLMRPGGVCIRCHTDMREGPLLTLAGTVYASGREVDDCNGLGSTARDPITVDVIDAMGRTTTMTPNAAGNFFSNAVVTLPITAVVRYQGRERRMLTPVMSGDCNSCHTLRGTEMAPGRIVVP